MIRIAGMDAADALPDDIDALKAALHRRDGAGVRVEAELAIARAKASDDAGLIAHLKLQIAKLQRELYGPRSERTARLLDQMELPRGAGELRHRGRDRRRAGRRADDECRRLHPQAPVAPALPRASAARAGGRAGAGRLPVLRRGAAAQARRGRHRDAGSDPAPVEGDPACAREVHLPRLREDQPGAGAVPRHAARLGRPQPAGDDPVREVRPASAAEPPGRALRRREGVPLSLSTLADQVGAGCAALAPLLQRLEAHVFAAERLHGDDTTVPVLAKGKTDHRAMLDLCARRSAVRRRGAAGGGVLLLARPQRRASAAASRELCRASCRPTPMAATASSTRPTARPGPILEAACWAHARRPFFALADIEAAARRKARRQNARGHLADRAGGGAAHRRAVRRSSAPSTARVPRGAGPYARS